MKLSSIACAFGSLLISSPWVAGQSIRMDSLAIDPALEIVHLFNGQWPTGIAVSKSGRKFACYPGGLDMANVNQGIPGIFTVSELTSNDTETAYPNVTINTPPGGAVDRTKVPAVTKGLPNYFLGVQSVVVDPHDTLWVLDTGRVQDLQGGNNVLLNSTYGGPKLVAIDLTTNSITRSIIFPRDVALPDSYLNDVRFDFVHNYAYLTDSSLDGKNAIIVVNLATGKSFRRLEQAKSPTKPIPNVTPFVYGLPMYQVASATEALHPVHLTFGADGIAVSPDASTLYFSAIAGRFLYSVPTAALRSTAPGADAAALAQVQNLGEKGISDGLETDTNGIVYAGNAEQDAVMMYNPGTTYVTPFTRDPRINWVDTMSIATDGYLYFTTNQLNDLPAIYQGSGLPLIDHRQRPFVAFRKKLANGGTKITS